MGAELNLNAVNEIPKGTVIYEKDENVQTVSLILKGRVLIRNEGLQAVVGSGFFLGINDLFLGRHGASYVALDGVRVFPLAVNHPERIETIFSMNPDYGSLIVISLSKYIRDMTRIHGYLSGTASNMHQQIRSCYNAYRLLGRVGGYAVEEMEEVEQLERRLDLASADMKKAEYYAACTELSVEVQKRYYSGDVILSYHIESQSELANSLVDDLADLAHCIRKICKFAFLGNGDDFLGKVGKMAVNLRNSGKKAESAHLVSSIGQIAEMIGQVDDVLLKTGMVNMSVDRKALEELVRTVASGEAVQEEASKERKGSVESLHGSLRQILDFSGIPSEEAEEYAKLMRQFAALKDKTASDDASRNLRRQLAKGYYRIYEEAFLRSHEKGSCPLAVDLFLRYGFMDEGLLTEEQLEDLVGLAETSRDEQDLCGVYDMKQWLTLIYEEKKLPSKSEFDMDYEESVRAMRKSNEVTDAEAEKLMHDPRKKLEYEITNMFAYNNRIVSGQISTFVPFLYDESFIGKAEQSLLTSELVNAAVRRVENIDYSAFARNVIYIDPDHRIMKEYQIKKVYPDIVLMPISGSNGSMWQEFSGRKRDSKGRFLLPMFLQGNLDDIMVRLIGRFRWEVCRTEQGAAWNNIKYKSLTSEYMDYIQFYRKNRDLSDDKKEKLKAQIQKARGNTREVFVIDYETWVKNESQGAIRLNKIAREILATYCPFSKEIRESVEGQPIFAEAMARYGREKTAKIKELDLRHRALAKESIALPQELEETYRFYKDM